jgi:hypothetical protein
MQKTILQILGTTLSYQAYEKDTPEKASPPELSHTLKELKSFISYEFNT